MLTIRKKGKNGFYYVRGTVRVGKETIKLSEQSTGTNSTAKAKEFTSKLEEDIRKKILYGDIAKTENISFDECMSIYLSKKQLKNNELSKIETLRVHFSGMYISDLKKVWNDFCIKNKHLKANSQNRYLGVIKAIVNFAAEEMEFIPPSLKKQKVKDQIVRHLNDDVRTKLLSCYSAHTRPIFTVLSLQGFRLQECLQTQWEDINLRNKTIFIKTSKNGESRSIPMNKKTWWIISRLYIAQKKPSAGHVFKNRYGKGYTDTRNSTYGGGSPVRRAHIIALGRLKNNYSIDIKFRIHDWRHDWASRMVMAGVDLITLQHLGGWKSIEMVKRYATFSKEHAQTAINKI